MVEMEYSMIKNMRLNIASAIYNIPHKDLVIRKVDKEIYAGLRYKIDDNFRSGVLGIRTRNLRVVNHTLFFKIGSKEI